MGQLQKKSIIEQIVQDQGIYKLEAAPDERKFWIYKLALKEIEHILMAEEIAGPSLSSIKTALNDIENGFLYLLNRPKVNKRDIRIVMPKLFAAKGHVTTALTELGRGGSGKRFEYSLALSNCKLLIVEINQQLS
jgi:hypothetical protein